jgi:hypothetical protein
MEAPRPVALRGSVTSDDFYRALRLLPRRRGIEQLARLLGFHATLRPRRPPRATTAPGAVVLTVRNGSLKLHVVRVRCPLSVGLLRALLRDWYAEDPASHHLVLLLEPRGRRIAVGTLALDGETRQVTIEPSELRASDVDVLREIATAVTRSGSAAAFDVARAMDRRTLTKRFFGDVRAVRDVIARAWRNVPVEARRDRDALALLLLSRLMFLYFLQHRNLLDSRERFLPDLLERWQRAPGAGTFYRATLRTLFFGVLNRRPARRTARARALGELPYLNGGLFELHRLEREYPRLDLPDETVAAIFSMLLERYRFTSTEASGEDAGSHGGIDPELLGQIFEGLMPGETRAATGTFYTPSAAVDSLVVETLIQHLAAEHGIDERITGDIFAGADGGVDVLRESLRHAGADDGVEAALRGSLRHACAGLRVIDPACGSGAFLVGALGRIAQVLSAAEPGRPHDAIRRDVVAHSLFGVDLLEDAALLCSLRLWLALVPDCSAAGQVPPLPNLDRSIRQGDALIDPLDTRGPESGSLTPARRATLRQLDEAGRAYMVSGPESRGALRRRIHRLERGLARAWLDALARALEGRAAELHARAGDRDLFGDPSTAALKARAAIPGTARRLDELTTLRAALRASGALPFFSFPVHFVAGAAGFDVVLSNPPWVRAHAWPATTATLLRERYRVCAHAGWPHAATLTRTPVGAGAQVDLAFLFLERAVNLLREGGTMGLVLPAKLLRSLAPGAARELLLRDAPLTYLEDHSLDQRAIFNADAFTTVVVARRTSERSSRRVLVRMTRAGVANLEFALERDRLPLVPGDHRAPWLLAPPECAEALRALQRAGTPLGEELVIRRGAMTSANDRMIVTDARPKLGDLVEITTARGTRAIIEAECVRPILRGADIRAWRATHSGHVLWSPANEDRRARAPRRLAALLARDADRYARTADCEGRLQRISSGMFQHRIVWSDVARDLRVAAIAPTVRTCGADRPLVPLNTVYFAPVPDRATALLLSAYLNSLPLRTFARAIAERAKDAHFRFFAWTVAMLPLPAGWRSRSAAALIRIAQSAHDEGSLDEAATHELDRIVGESFGLKPEHYAALAAFDRWLRGVS